MNTLYELDRRNMLGRVLVILGASATGGLSFPALAGSASRAQPYLEEGVFTLLSAVADTIVPATDTPGAAAVRVPAQIDGLLVNWASGERRYEITKALAAIEAKAQARHAAPFAILPAEARHALLQEHDQVALKVVPRPSVRGVTLSAMAGPAYADPGYAKLKELIVLLYYMSEVGLTRELSYVHAPGAWVPSVPVTPETRPAGGTLF